jgi:hypothetical protein
MKVKLNEQGSAPQLVKLPPDLDVLLFLIMEDLKAHKLSHNLNETDTIETTYVPDLSTLVLTAAGLHDHTHELYKFYFTLLDKCISKLNGNYDQLMKQVMKVYVALSIKKKEIKLSQA